MERVKERWRKLRTWLSLHHREVLGVVSVFVLVLFIATPALAQTTPAGQPDGDIGVINKIALWIATIFAWIAQQVVKFIVALIDIVIVPIMQYNHFVDSPIVTQGWTVVRDLVNMFFVVVLLIIAFQTIFGVGRADWKRQVPRLLIMAVVINFSRTIAGVLIDFGQVVMLTFVNAISNVAGGNFIQLFGLDKLFSYSAGAIAKASQSGVGFEVFDLFGAAFLTMILTFVILATMVILAGLLALRIVVLWCLVIVMPLTFFLGGAKGVIGGAEGYYADWWKRFTSAISLGPILTFFVWLALGAASTGNLSEKQMFDVQTQANGDELASVGGQITQAFDAPHLTSLIIALALLFAGFEVSQQTASSIGGRAGSLASSGIKGIPGLARSLAKVGVPIGAAAGVGTALTVGVGATGVAAGSFAATGLGLIPGGAVIGGAAGAARYASGRKDFYLKRKEKAGAALRDMGAAIAGVPLLGAVGRRAARAGTSLVQGVEHAQEHDLAEAQKKVAGMDTASRVAMLDALKGSGRYQDQVMRQAIVVSSLLSKPTRKEIAGRPNGMEELRNLAEVWYQDIRGKADDATLEKIGKVLAAEPMLAAGKADAENERRTGESDADFRRRIAAARQSEINDQVSTFTKRGDAANIAPRNFQDPLVRNAMRNQPFVDGMSMEEYILNGRAGPEQQRAYQQALEGDRARRQNDIATAVTAVAGAAPAGGQALVDALNNLGQQIRNLSPEDIRGGTVTAEQLRNPNFFDQFIQNAPPSAMGALRENPALMAAFSDTLQENLNRVSTPAREAEAIRAAAVRAAEEPIETRRAAERQAVINRAIDPFREEQENRRKQQELAEIDRRFDQEIAAVRGAAGAPPAAPPNPDLVRYIEASVRAGQPLAGYNPATQRFAGQAYEEAIRQMVVENPQVVVELGDALTSSNFSNQLARAVGNAVSTAQLNNMQQQYIAATSPADQDRIVAALAALQRSIAANAESVAESNDKLASILRFRQRFGR